MASIYVFDCTLDLNEKDSNNLKNLEKLRSEAEKTHQKLNDSIPIKPLQFFIANKYPLFIPPDNKKLNNNIGYSNFYTKNIEIAKNILNKNFMLIDK